MDQGVLAMLLRILPVIVQRTKEEVWLHRLRDMLTTEIGSSDTIAKPEALALANASSE